MAHETKEKRTAVPNQAAAKAEPPPFSQIVVLPVSEYMLTVLPLIVLIIVDLALGRPWREILASAEWSFASAVLFGLALFKTVIGVVKGKAAAWENVGLVVVLIVVVGLVPSLIVLALRLAMPDPSMGLLLTQGALFVVASVVFVILGSVAHGLLFHAGALAG